jgi:hypothetical protein
MPHCIERRYSLAVDWGVFFGGGGTNRLVYFAIFDRGAGEPRRGRLLPIRGIWSVVSGEVKKSSAQAGKLRSLSNPVKVKV